MTLDPRALALLLAYSSALVGACARDAPRRDEALLIPVGTTSGGAAAVGTVIDPTPVHTVPRTISLGAVDDPTDTGGGTAAPVGAPAARPNGTLPYRTQSTVTIVGTVNGNYGAMPSSGDATPPVDTRTGAANGPSSGVITH